MATVPSPPPCDRCTRPTVFSIRLNRLGDTPTFNIYHCAACGRMMWIPLAAE